MCGAVTLTYVAPSQHLPHGRHVIYVRRMLSCILYVSRSRLVPSETEDQIRQIVQWSSGWNAAVGITGALVFTERHFSQYIEGPPDAVAALFSNIRSDQRHTDITIRRNRAVSHRRFEGWSLAFWGPALFLEPSLLPLLADLPDEEIERRTEDLILLMEGFTARAENQPPALGRPGPG